MLVISHSTHASLSGNSSRKREYVICDSLQSAGSTELRCLAAMNLVYRCTYVSSIDSYPSSEANMCSYDMRKHHMKQGEFRTRRRADARYALISVGRQNVASEVAAVAPKAMAGNQTTGWSPARMWNAT